MPDIVSPEVRSRMMSGIRGKNTKPEMLLRTSLHALGFRFRLHNRKLPGCPDLVLPKYNAVIFVHGCFWHGHNCSLFKMPASREEFWATKIEGNHARDRIVQQQLNDAGWRSLTVWECAFRGPGRLGLESTVQSVAAWLRCLDIPTAELRGQE